MKKGFWWYQLDNWFATMDDGRRVFNPIGLFGPRYIIATSEQEDSIKRWSTRWIFLAVISGLVFGIMIVVVNYNARLAGFLFVVGFTFLWISALKRHAKNMKLIPYACESSFLQRLQLTAKSLFLNFAFVAGITVYGMLSTAGNVALYFQTRDANHIFLAVFAASIMVACLAYNWKHRGK